MSKLKKAMNKIYIDETEDYYKKYNETINFEIIQKSNI